MRFNPIAGCRKSRGAGFAGVGRNPPIPAAHAGGAPRAGTPPAGDDTRRCTHPSSRPPTCPPLARVRRPLPRTRASSRRPRWRQRRFSPPGRRRKVWVPGGARAEDTLPRSQAHVRHAALRKESPYSRSRAEGIRTPDLLADPRLRNLSFRRANPLTVHSGWLPLFAPLISKGRTTRE